MKFYYVKTTEKKLQKKVICESKDEYINIERFLFNQQKLDYRSKMLITIKNMAAYEKKTMKG